MSRILANSVSRDYLGRRGSVVRALEEFSLDIEPGEFVSLVGPSGCGKSTFLRMVAGLIRPSTGEIELTDSRPGSPLCATVFQEYSVFPWRTVEANVRYGLDVKGVPRGESDARVEKWLDVVGLLPFRKAYPATLSGGMKQRVALARAFVMEPQILLMDEPFAALDAQLRMMMQEELLKIWQQYQHTVLMVTHSLDEAILLGDRVVLMTNRPGRHKATFHVPFARPRSPEIRAEPDFRRLEQDLWLALREELA
jgi:NitT/TauT family transport system ATP-binding protein